MLDECIVLVMKGPHSYTAEDVVEINCHGGVVVMKKVLEAAFQMMFAMITPALITGSVAGRMKFKALVLFIILWSLIVYYPMAHMV